MENNTQFRITYYSNTDKKHITRQGKWTDQCRYWTDNSGKAICTYFDIEADNFRNATVSWTMKGDK